MSKWRWKLIRIARTLWVRATLLAALGVVGAVLATLADRLVPYRIPFSPAADAVDDILSILATSMLAVTTFSLTTMTAAFSASTNNVTPRATQLLMQDRVTQSVLSTFVGSFMFSIVGLVVLKTGVYGAQGRAVLFILSILVVALVVVALLRWIDRLIKLGRVGATTSRVEAVTAAALQARIREPHLGGARFDGVVPPSARPVPSPATGYVQHVDTGHLQDCADAAGCLVLVAVLPGTFVPEGEPLAFVVAGDEGAGGDAEDLAARMHDAFSVGEARSFDQDPRFGLVVLAEIAARALSPAMNDPGTAIDVVGRATRLLLAWGNRPPEKQPPRLPRVRAPGLSGRDLMDDVFRAIGRDGAGHVDVQLRLRKALAILAHVADPEIRIAAHEQADLALRRAKGAPMIEDDMRLLEAVALDDARPG